MKNWDENEFGNAVQPRMLRMQEGYVKPLASLYTVNFVQKYWDHVFAYFR